jgi:uncharacterized LabA/DUF88 family protein
MDRAAVFVDAGYLFAEGSRLLAGQKLRRSALRLEHDKIMGFMDELTRELTGLPLLRVYWYDGATSAPNPAQVALAYRPKLKLRLGLVDDQGQRDVDGLLVADLVTLAKNRAICDALLLSGDDDLRAGVEEAQAFGVRVQLLAIPPARQNQAGALVQSADGVRELSESEVREFLVLSSPV